MKDSQNEDQLEQTLISIWKEFAYYLKESAKNLDARMHEVEGKMNDMDKDFAVFKNDYENWKKSDKDRFTLSLTQAAIIFIVFVISTGLSIWGLMK
jgi:hypothetical protein